MPGTLFVVATPIGNLEDLTFRALRTLREVAAIAAEDTRRTAKLLAHYEISRPLVSVREQNEARATGRLVERLQAGESIALVTDAGTPGIADPGARVVRAARDAGIKVVPIPGPTAVAAALSITGIPADEFTFMGFPPATGAARIRWFERLAAETRTVVCFEAPHRIRRTLAQLQPAMGERPILVYREITKINEELVVWDNTQQLDASIREQGEFTLVIGPLLEATLPERDEPLVTELFCQLIDIHKIDETLALELVASRFKTTPQRVRRLVKEARILAKRADERVP